MIMDEKSLESTWIPAESLLRAVHLPKLLNVVDDLKENLKSLLIEFADDI